MNIIEVVMIGVGLSMDAFAVSIGKGLNMGKIRKNEMFWIALFFGGFQALMPVAGYLAGKQFAGKIMQIDHWIAFFLLVMIGFNMVTKIRKNGAENIANSSAFSLAMLFGEISPKTNTTMVITTVEMVAPYTGYSCKKNTVAIDDVDILTILFPTSMVDNKVS